MNKHLCDVAAAAVLVVAGPVLACDGDARDTGTLAAPVLEQTLDRLRAEQREQIVRSAQLGLARLRSETETALARGAAPAAGTAVKAGP